ncbi:MAG: UrcA family protein [Pseudomonadota bacterium]
MKRSLLIALAAAATLSFASTAPASADTGHFSQVVSYGDLNVSSPDGARVLLARINRAAENVCQLSYAPQPLSFRQDQEECVRTTVSQTVARLHMPTVVAMYEGDAAPSVIASR